MAFYWCSMQFVSIFNHLVVVNILENFYQLRIYCIFTAKLLLRPETLSLIERLAVYYFSNLQITFLFV